MTVMLKVQGNHIAKRYAEITAPHIATICQPLFSNLDFAWFAYIKILPNNKMLHLTSDPNWSKNYFEHEFYDKTDCFDQFRRSLLNNETKNFVLTGDIKDDYTSWLYNFGLWHSCSIYKRQNDIIEGWVFVPHRENQKILDFYLNSRNVLKNFIYYFNEKAKDHIYTNDTQKLIHLNIKKPDLSIKKNNYNEYMDKLNIKNFRIEVKNREILLTKKELECVTYLLKGYSTKRIASNMNASPRTIERYLDQLKSKMNLKRKGEIIEACENTFLLPGL